MSLNSSQYLPRKLRDKPLYERITTILDWVIHTYHEETTEDILNIHNPLSSYFDPDRVIELIGGTKYSQYLFEDIDKENLAKTLGRLYNIKGSKKGIQYILNLLDLNTDIYEWWEINDAWQAVARGTATDRQKEMVDLIGRESIPSSKCAFALLAYEQTSDYVAYARPPDHPDVVYACEPQNALGSATGDAVAGGTETVVSGDTKIVTGTVQAGLAEPCTLSLNLGVGNWTLETDLEERLIELFNLLVWRCIRIPFIFWVKPFDDSYVFLDQYENSEYTIPEFLSSLQSTYLVGNYEDYAARSCWVATEPGRVDTIYARDPSDPEVKYACGENGDVSQVEAYIDHTEVSDQYVNNFPNAFAGDSGVVAGDGHIAMWPPLSDYLHSVVNYTDTIEDDYITQFDINDDFVFESKWQEEEVYSTSNWPNIAKVGEGEVAGGGLQARWDTISYSSLRAVIEEYDDDGNLLETEDREYLELPA